MERRRAGVLIRGTFDEVDQVSHTNLILFDLKRQQLALGIVDGRQYHFLLSFFSLPLEFSAVPHPLQFRTLLTLPCRRHPSSEQSTTHFHQKHMKKEARRAEKPRMRFVMS